MKKNTMQLVAGGLTASLALSACGNNEDQRAAEAISASLMENASGEDEDGEFGVDQEQADCIGEGFVDKIGVDQLKEYGILTDDVEADGTITDVQMSVEDADNAADVLVGCVDTSSLMADSFAEDDTMTEEEQACMLEAFNDDALKKMFSLLFQGKEQEATADLMGPVMSCMMQGESMWGDDMSGEVGGDAASATVPPAPSMSDLSGGGDEDADPDAPGGQNNPLGLGDEFEVGDWTVKVNSVEEDATETILAENQFNEPPSEGNQFMLVNIDATYNGDTSGTAYWDLRPTFVTGTGNTAGGQLSDMCGSYPGNLMYEGEQFPGSTVTGNLCVSFPSDQVDGAMMITEVMDFDNNDRVFVELN